MLDFRMDTFLAVCQFMNYTRAAEALNLTQPAVSQHIRWLEAQYGVPLFTYANKRLTLTPQGEQLRSAATTMKHDVLSLQRRLHEPGPGVHRLRLGATPTAGTYLLPQALARYHETYPLAPISLRISNTQTLCAALDAGELDAALVEGFFCKSDYDSLLFRREPYLAVCSAQYPFARPPRVLADLLSEPLVIREKGSGNREIVRRALSRQNLAVEDFPCLIEVNDMHVLKQMLLRSCGVGFLYQAAAQDQLDQGLLREIPLEDFHESHDITFLWRRGSVFSPHYHQLFHFLLPSYQPPESPKGESSHGTSSLPSR